MRVPHITFDLHGCATFGSLKVYICIRVLPRKNPQSGTRFDKVCHIAELEGIMLEGIYGNYYYRGNKFILC